MRLGHRDGPHAAIRSVRATQAWMIVVAALACRMRDGIVWLMDDEVRVTVVDAGPLEVRFSVSTEPKLRVPRRPRCRHGLLSG